MRWPLRYQILLPFAGVMLLVLLGASLLNAYLAAARTEQQIAAQLRDIAKTLSAATFPLPDPVLKQMRALSGAEFVLVAADGTVLATSDGRLGGSLAGGAQNAERKTQNDEAGLGQMVEVGGERYFHSALHVEGRGAQGEPANVHILYPERILREARWQAAWPPLAVGAAALVLVVILAFAIAGRLSRPILNLRTQLASIASGKFQPLPLPARNDELRDLMASANSLAAQLRELEQAIQRAERLAILGQLSGGLVHHLRNDVTGARMAVQLHQRHCREADQESMAVALRQLSLTEEHLQRFLADVPQNSQRIEVDLRSVVDDLQIVLRPICRHLKVDLQIRPGNEPVILKGDPAQIRQMLLNLVLNGIDAACGSVIDAAAGRTTEIGTVSGWVRIEVDHDDQIARVRVSDSGPGVPSIVGEKMFEPLVTGKPEGIGLGLAVARQVAESHGGSVRYSRGAETCFEVVLPLVGSGVGSGTSETPVPRENTEELLRR